MIKLMTAEEQSRMPMPYFDPDLPTLSCNGTRWCSIGFIAVESSYYPRFKMQINATGDLVAEGLELLDPVPTYVWLKPENQPPRLHRIEGNDGVMVRRCVINDT